MFLGAFETLWLSFSPNFKRTPWHIVQKKTSLSNNHQLILWISNSNIFIAATATDVPGPNIATTPERYKYS